MLVFLILLLAVTSAAYPTSTTPKSTTTTTYYWDSALGYPCVSNTNCGGLVGNSMCSNGICVCQPGYYPEGVMRCVWGKK